MREIYNYHEEEVLGKGYDGRGLIILTCIILLFKLSAAELARPYLVKIAIDDYIIPGPQLVW